MLRPISKFTGKNHVKVMLIIFIVSSFTACAIHPVDTSTSEEALAITNAVRQKQAADLEAQRLGMTHIKATDYEQYAIQQLKKIQEQGAIRRGYLTEIQRINDGSLTEQIVGIFTIPGIAVKAENAAIAQKAAAESLTNINQLLQSSTTTLQLLKSSATTSRSLAASANVENITGKWIGYYECSQGIIGVTLMLNGSQSGLIEGVFLFYPMLSNPSAGTGSFMVKGSYFSDGSLVLSGGAWIERPANYIAVGLKEKTDSALVNISGVVPECSNSVFSVTRFTQ